MTITTNELRKLLDEATKGPWVWKDAVTDELWDGDEYLERASLRTVERFPHSFGTLPKFILDAEQIGGADAANAHLIAMAPVLARRVIAAEKLVKALREALSDSEENGRQMICYWVDDASIAIAEYEAIK